MVINNYYVSLRVTWRYTRHRSDILPQIFFARKGRESGLSRVEVSDPRSEEDIFVCSSSVSGREKRREP